MSTYKRFMAVADNHGKLACPEAIAKAVGFAADWKPHYRIHLGDVWDFSPLRGKATQEEKADGIADDYQMGWEFLAAYKPTHLTLGNHDDRIWDHAASCGDGMLRERCAQLAAEAEEEFRKRRIQFATYSVDAYLQLPEGGPKLIHGFRATMYPAKAHYENWGECLHGHVHKPDLHHARNINKDKAFSVPCIADIQKLTYADRQPARLGWRNGFLFGLIHSKTGRWEAWNVVREDGDWISPHGIL